MNQQVNEWMNEEMLKWMIDDENGEWTHGRTDGQREQWSESEFYLFASVFVTVRSSQLIASSSVFADHCQKAQSLVIETQVFHSRLSELVDVCVCVCVCVCVFCCEQEKLVAAHKPRRQNVHAHKEVLHVLVQVHLNDLHFTLTLEPTQMSLFFVHGLP